MPCQMPSHKCWKAPRLHPCRLQVLSQLSYPAAGVGFFNSRQLSFRKLCLSIPPALTAHSPCLWLHLLWNILQWEKKPAILAQGQNAEWFDSAFLFFPPLTKTICLSSWVEQASGFGLQRGMRDPTGLFDVWSLAYSTWGPSPFPPPFSWKEKK